MDLFRKEDESINDLSTSSTNFFKMRNVRDETNLQKAVVILGQAIPSSGSGFLTCSN